MDARSKNLLLQNAENIMKIQSLMLAILFSTGILLIQQTAFAAESQDPSKEEVYVMVEPYLYTNFIKKSGRLGVLNTLPGIITTKENEALVNDNMPFVKDFLVSYLSSMPEQKLKDIAQRKAIQDGAVKGLQQLFQKEVGKKVVTGLIFKKFLTQ